MKLDQQAIGFITVFENVTRARVKDLYKDKTLLFIVEQGDIGKAIGKQGSNIKRVASLLNKKIKVIEFNYNPEKFLKNLISPLKGKIYKEDEESIIIESSSRQDKAYLIGKNKRNLTELQKIIGKYYNLEIIIK